MTIVKSADRVIQILEAIGERKDGITHGELSKSLNIPKGSLSRLCANLVNREYLSFDVVSKLYTLGPQILALTRLFLANLDIARIGQPVLHELTMTIDEDTEIAVMKGTDVLIVCKESSTRPLRRVIAIGDRYPMYATSAGKAILAYLPKTEIDRYLSSVELRPITKRTITDAKALTRELKEIRSKALAYSREEVHEGVTGMAAPVFDLYDKVVASVVVTIPTFRLNRKRVKVIEGSLRDASESLSRKLGFGKADRF